METQLKSLIEKYCLNSDLTDNQLDEIIDLALKTKANPKEVEEYIQKTDVERKARKEEDERKVEAERKAKEQAIHEVEAEAKRKAEAERMKAEVKAYKKQKHAEAIEAYLHRKDSPEAVERYRVLWAEYDKIVKAIQSGRVETMDDLKRELDINLSNN